MGNVVKTPDLTQSAEFSVEIPGIQGPKGDKGDQGDMGGVGCEIWI